ncbi:MAG: hypothetical protein ACI4TP_05335 [Anaerotignum sp.]
MSRTCKKCGGAVGMTDLYCIHCGMPLEKEPPQEEKKKETEQNLAEPLSMGAYLLIGLILCIPIVNIILPIIWILNKGENPNRRNLAKAWLIFAAVGMILTGILSYGLFRLITVPAVPYEYYHYEYTIPGEERILKDIPIPMDEI